jgi:hypothetical protein
MDFSDFTSQDTTLLSLLKSGGNLETLTYKNWGWAATNVLVWNAFLTVGLATPVASFAEAFRHEPQQQDDGRWLWTYGFKVFGITHTAELYGSIDNDGTIWEMYISKEGVYDDFLWYTGTADLFATQGRWTLNKEPNAPVPLLQIDWTRDEQNSTGVITYTNILPGGPENGSYISFGVTTNTTYDAYYEIYTQSTDHLINIEWNRTSKEGRVKDPKHFQDSDWHCWNTKLEDVVCP